MLDHNFLFELETLDLSKNKYSQGGEEIVLQHIFKHIGTTDKFCCEFGAGDGYALSNTRRFIEEGWAYLMMDAEPRGNQQVKKEFITPDNIISLFGKYEVRPFFDLLSVDLDGMDFQILSRLIPHFKPRVLICEYNSNLPKGSSLYLMDEEGYYWDNTDKYGFSFMAGKKLIQAHGYTLVHNHNHLNQIYILDSVLGAHYELNIQHDYVRVHPHNPHASWMEFNPDVRIIRENEE